MEKGKLSLSAAQDGKELLGRATISYLLVMFQQGLGEYCRKKKVGNFKLLSGP